MQEIARDMASAFAYSLPSTAPKRIKPELRDSELPVIRINGRDVDRDKRNMWHRYNPDPNEYTLVIVSQHVPV
jgi:hypothetical protein